MAKVRSTRPVAARDTPIFDPNPPDGGIIAREMERGDSAPRILIVVSRERQDLYEYLRRGFEDMDDIKVILDRRIALRGVPSVGRTGADLRERPDMSEELQQRGFTLIHLW